MHQRYEIEQLQRLRASPLICKPENLPPMEEWMGTSHDTNQRKPVVSRGKQDDSATQTEPPHRRGLLPEGLHNTRRSSTGPEDIVLGPPKTAFASANARNTARNATQDTSDEVSGNKERFSFHERLAKDKDYGAKESERKEGRYSGTNGRQFGKEDREDWQSGRSRRNHDQEDGDTRPRRTIERDRDRPRWDSKDSKDQAEAGTDARRTPREDSRLPPRRDGQGRTRFDQPWFRGDKQQDSAEEGGKSESKQEWRRDRWGPRGVDKEWDRSTKDGQEPEWMDSSGPEEPRQAHTQEDFQRWKERMRSGGTPSEEKTEPPHVEVREDPPKQEQKKSEKVILPTFVNTPEIDAGMDKFFEFFNEKKAASDQKTTENKAPRKPRFAALFSPQAEEPPKEPLPAQVVAEIEEPRQNIAEPPQHVSEPRQYVSEPRQYASEPRQHIPEPRQNISEPPSTSTDADQEGFRRILQMLGGRSINITPQSQISTKPKSQLFPEIEHQTLPDQPQSPTTGYFPKQDRPMVQENYPRNRNSAGLESLLGPRSPVQMADAKRDTAQNRDSDFLLRLMQQSRISPNPPSQQQHNTNQTSALGHTPGILQMPDSITRQSNMQKPKGGPPLLFDDPAISSAGHRPEQQPPRENLQRRPTNGPLPPFLDERFFTDLRQTDQQNPGPPQGNAGRGRVPPPGVQRPPGFDHMPLPQGWPGHHQQMPVHPQQQQQMPLSAPPGISNPSQRGMNPSYPSGPPMSHNMGMPPSHQGPAAPRQRKYTADNGPAFPPSNMGPPAPPGLMSGPPPGFPSLPHGMGVPAGGQYEVNSNLPPPRHLMDLFAGGDRNGGRGIGNAGGMSGNYR